MSPGSFSVSPNLPLLHVSKTTCGTHLGPINTLKAPTMHVFMVIISLSCFTYSNIEFIGICLNVKCGEPLLNSGNDGKLPE